ncbi:MAG: hypothetical protein ABI895_00320 [Deltaproteobacteria bacterium]
MVASAGRDDLMDACAVDLDLGGQGLDSSRGASREQGDLCAVRARSGNPVLNAECPAVTKRFAWSDTHSV